MFIADHVLPLGELFATRVKTNEAVLTAGQGWVENIYDWRWDDIQPERSDQTP